MFGKKKPEVLVVGAGPVGLFTALALVKRGIHVLIVDKEQQTASQSAALVLHAHTLRLLKEFGLLEKVERNAFRIHSLGYYDDRERKAEVSLASDTGGPGYIAVLPQNEFESILEKALEENGVKVLWNHSLSRLERLPDHVVATIDKLELDSLGYSVAHSEWVVSRSREIEVEYVIGCDGYDSEVRRSSGIPFPEVAPPQHFAVFEFDSEQDTQHEMRIVLGETNTNVLWPIPGGRFRWSFELNDFTVAATSRTKERMAFEMKKARFPVLSEDSLHMLLSERAAWFSEKVNRIDWRIVVRFEKRLVPIMGRDRIWLAGDAAHLTGPVGGHSMNRGIREGYELAGILARIKNDSDTPATLQSFSDSTLAEWRMLAGLEGQLATASLTRPWLAHRADRLLACLPATGDDLERLVHRLGLELPLAVF